MRRRKSREINIFSMSALDLFASALGAFILIAIIALPYYLKVEPVLKKLKIAENNIKQLKNQNQTLENSIKECNENQKKCKNRLAKQKIRNKKLEEQQRKSERRNRELEAKRKRAERKNKELELKQNRAEKKNRGLEEKNREFQRRLSKTFCVVTLKWNTPNRKQDIDLHVIDPTGNRYYYHQTTHGTSAFLAVDSKNVSRGAEVWVDSNLKEGKYKIQYVYYSGVGGPVRVTGSVLTNSFTKKLPTKTLYTPNKDKRIDIATIVVHPNGQSSLQLH